MPWVRSGYCCRCGECCVGDPFANSPDDPNRSELMRRAARVQGMCPLYELHVGNPNGDGFCAGHTGAVPAGQEDPYYLAGCNVWPQHPDNIKDKPNCTYTFAWVD
jgi:hypothetical protein